jgi:hypothetical protein
MKKQTLINEAMKITGLKTENVGWVKRSATQMLL